MNKINGLMAKDYLESSFFVGQVKLHKKDNTDKKWSYKIQSGKKSEFAFDPKTTTTLNIWFDCLPPSIEGVEDIEDISKRNHGTSLDRVFSGGLHKPKYKATITTLEALKGVVRYLNGGGLDTSTNESRKVETTKPEIESSAERYDDSSSEPPTGNREPHAIATEVIQYQRDQNVVSWVQMQANDACESCGRKAPFLRDDGTPFLEVHHLRRLADGGSDTVTNAIAVCPNCHRELHYGLNKEAAKLAIYGRVERLIAE